MARSSSLSFGQVRSPIRRVLAVDAGSRCLKLLLAQSYFGRFRILKEELLDLQAEGLVSDDEVKTHLQTALDNWGRPALALVLPQHLSISQVIDLPAAEEQDVEKLIAEETIKLGGVSESRIVFDFVPVASEARDHRQFWVTLCQEGDIRERIERLGLDQDDICEITTTANALLASYQASSPTSLRAILVHLGAQSTVVVVLAEGQGTFATAFQMGGDFLTRALARIQQCPEPAAESIKRTRNLLTGQDASPEYATAIDGWAMELKRQLQEWFESNASIPKDLARYDLIATGGGFEEPGLLDYLREKAALSFQRWPKGVQPKMDFPSTGFEVAFGAALQALGYSQRPVSLLPEAFRVSWRKRLARERIEIASLALLIVCVLTLAFGTWHQLSLIGKKEALLAKVLDAQNAVAQNEAFTDELVTEYENLRPVLAAQQQSTDTLKALALLQQSRSNRNFWYVLVTDQQTYFTQPAATATLTNRPAKTNLLAGATDPARPSFSARQPAALSTNTLPSRPGLIAELCIPGEAEASRNLLREIVNELQKQPLFAKVDLLSEDLRRNLADPKLEIPDRSYVLALDFAVSEYHQPTRTRKPSASGNLPKRPRVPRVAENGHDEP